MSEYMEKHSVSRLIGAPPGYVGYDEGGQLTEAIRRRPYSIILLDEIEKAHPDVYNILLQVLDDGRLTDGQGRIVDFKNTMIIMTSNLGSAIIQSEDSEAVIQTQITELLKSHFRPEFLNRIDDTIIFKSLTTQELTQIIDIQLNQLQQRLTEHHLTLTVTPSAKHYICVTGFDPTFGARPLKRTITQLIQNPLATKILEGSFNEGDQITINYSDEKGLTFDTNPRR